MGDSAIDYVDKGWSPVRGCTRVSEGCRHCWAERQAIRDAGGRRAARCGVRSPREEEDSMNDTAALHQALDEEADAAVRQYVEHVTEMLGARPIDARVALKRAIERARRGE